MTRIPSSGRGGDAPGTNIFITKMGHRKAAEMVLQQACRKRSNSVGLHQTVMKRNWTTSQGRKEARAHRAKEEADKDGGSKKVQN